MRAVRYAIVFAALLASGSAAQAADAKKPPAAPPAPAAAVCANPNAIGVSRTVEIDTKGGPGFGFEQYKAYDFLEPKEVVLTFDDGPQVNSTKAVLDALAAHCAKATFFSIGKMAVGLPELIREVAKAGHTIGSHTWSHADLRRMKVEKDAESEIERGLSGVHRAVGAPIAPFFRFPFLLDNPAMLKHLADRNIAVFSMDVDSFDFKNKDPAVIVKVIMEKLEKKGKGIVLMHDIHMHTAKAVPMLLERLKADGYKLVHIRAAANAETLPEYDALIEKDVKGLPAAGSERPMSSVVRTVPSTP
jgi:peptidoglycan-N-acetylglucosamine deacetylase